LKKNTPGEDVMAIMQSQLPTTAVLGATGLIGSHVIQALIARGQETVRAVARNLDLFADTLPEMERHTADLTNFQQAAQAVRSCDTVYCAAGVVASAPVLARDPVGPVLTNLRIATTCLEACRAEGVRRYVFVSSTTGYPLSDAPLSEELFFLDRPPPGWDGLGEMARYCERHCAWHADLGPMSVAVVRPALVYGARDHFDEQSAHFLPSLARRVLTREFPIEVWGDGETRRDLIHAADVAQGMLRAAASPQQYGVWNLAAGQSTSVNECLQVLLDLEGLDGSALRYRPDKPSSTQQRQFCPEKALRELGFQATMSLRAGLEQTLPWGRAFLRHGARAAFLSFL
jgi:nucleoside-diphosphate-sugar epimerase